MNISNQYEVNRRQSRSNMGNRYIPTTTTALGLTAETLFPSVRKDIDLEMLDFADKEAGLKFLYEHSTDSIGKALSCVKLIAGDKQDCRFTDVELKNALRMIDDNRKGMVTVYSEVCEVIKDMAQLMFCVPMRITEKGKTINIRRSFQLLMVEKCDTEQATGDTKGLSVVFSPLIFKGEETELSRKDKVLLPKKTYAKLQYLKGRDSKEKSFNAMLSVTNHATEATILDRYLGYEQRRIYGLDLSHLTRDRKGISKRFVKARETGLITKWEIRRNGDIVTYYWECKKQLGNDSE